jgi:hypothetical protein
MINNYLLVLYFKYKFWNETWYIILSQFNEQWSKKSYISIIIDISYSNNKSENMSKKY